MAEIKSGAGTDKLTVNTDKQALIRPADLDEPTKVGAVVISSENDGGSITGTPSLISPETTLDYRLRVGIDTCLDEEIFQYTAQNTSRHRVTTTTLTVTYASGALTTNGGSVTTTATGAMVTTYRLFPTYLNAPTYFETIAATSVNMTSNLNLDFGGFIPGAAATNTPQDGVYFRWNSTGLMGVINNNGTETTTSPFSSFTPTANVFNKFIVVLERSRCLFYVDNVLHGSLARPSAAGSPQYSQLLGWGVRHHHTGTTGAALQFRVASYNVSVADIDLGKEASLQQAGMGLSAIQGASGQSQGQTANYTNSIVPTSATLSNTTAGYATLGGQFQFAAVAGAETDYALFGFLVTNVGMNIAGRNLIVNRIWIDTVNTGAAVATSSTILQWAVGVGATAVSLATAEAATTRAPRRIPLGIQTFAIADAIGKQAPRIDVSFNTPLMVENNCYLHIILRMPVGTATASQVIRGVVGVSAYWE